MKKFFLFFGILCSFTLFLVKASSLLDPDFGWHLRTGQIILSSGIPKMDPFSYTMPSYPYVDHSWLTDLVIAKLFPLIGMWGLALVSTLITFATIFIALSVKRAPSRHSLWLGLVLLVSSFFAFETVRPLIMSWLMFSFLLFVFWDKERLRKWRFLIPVVFLVWANLHGAFVVGLIAYGLFLAGASIRQKRVNLADVGTILVSIGVTLANPYGTGLWWQLWNEITSTHQKFAIAEWLPSIFSFEPAIMVLTALGAGLVIRYRSQLSLEKISLFLFFLFLAVSSVRHIPFLALVSVPILFEGLSLLISEVKKIKFGKTRLATAISFCFILSVFLFLVYGTTFIWRTFLSPQKESFYPEAAVNFLHQNLPSGQIFSTYGWGGYLIWKLPEKKVFIDGRMAIWEQNGRSIFKEYQQIVSGETDYEFAFAKYGVTTVLWPKLKKPSGLSNVLQEKINILFGVKDEGKDLGERLADNEWKKVYEDQVALVYRKE